MVTLAVSPYRYRHMLTRALLARVVQAGESPANGSGALKRESSGPRQAGSHADHDRSPNADPSSPALSGHWSAVADPPSAPATRSAGRERYGGEPEGSG